MRVSTVFGVVLRSTFQNSRARAARPTISVSPATRVDAPLARHSQDRGHDENSHISARSAQEDSTLTAVAKVTVAGYCRAFQ